MHRYTLRMKETTFELVKTAAERNNRSMAKEIEYALDHYYLFLPLISTIVQDYQNMEKSNDTDIEEFRDLIKEYLHNTLINGWKVKKS